MATIDIFLYRLKCYISCVCCCSNVLYCKVAAMQVYRETGVDSSRQKFIVRRGEIGWWWSLSWRHPPHWHNHLYLAVYLAAWNSIKLTFLPLKKITIEKFILSWVEHYSGGSWPCLTRWFPLRKYTTTPVQPGTKTILVLAVVVQPGTKPILHQVQSELFLLFPIWMIWLLLV